MKIVVIGGGAAGFFSAITCAETNPNAEVILIEKSSKLLSKVKISGGGRCNVTHHCFDPRLLVQYYPRGNKELLSAFSRFQPRDTIKWFEERGVELKTEADGRIFPVSDNSQTIIDCLFKSAEEAGVKIWQQVSVDKIEKKDLNFYLMLSNGKELFPDKVVIATGGSSKADSYNWLKKLGHTISEPVPSLFTFNIQDRTVHSLAGASVNKVTIKVEGSRLTSEGPILFTHWGFSGPAILKLSAWGARFFFEKKYRFAIFADWLPEYSFNDLEDELIGFKSSHPKKQLSSNPFSVPSRIWSFLLNRASVDENIRWADLSNKAIEKLCQEMKSSRFSIEGKSTFKEEFVTCGGVKLNEIDFKTMESKIVKGLFFAGEVIDVDGVTGGFNFQNAWTTGFIAGKACSDNS